MNIIDRYLLRQFALVFFICWCSMTGLFVVLDAFSHLDDFFHYAESRGSLLEIMGEYYAYRSIHFFDRISPILVLVSAMFTVTWLQRHNEMAPLLAAGISRRRVIRPVVIAAVAVSLAAMMNREFVIPQLSEELAHESNNLGGEGGGGMQPRYDLKYGYLFRGQMTFPIDQRIEKPNFLLSSSLDAESRQLTAENAYYQPANAQHPAGYLFRGNAQPADLLAGPSLRFKGEPVIITPHDQPDWLQPDECFVVSSIDFDLLTGGHRWRQFSSTWQLINGLRDHADEFGADVRVAIHSRILQPVLDITLLFLGLPVVLRRESRNIFVAIGESSVLVFCYMIVTMGCQHLGSNVLMRPSLASWLPAMIFIPLAVSLFDRVDR